ncbi:uncharacterized protein LOC134264193 [Saccostrea cucullata]|uniref:uncharacterized protein LOC134264193 n=1 Tax=Saccostrea cuccullata TaxID=36930 RepID=UPI002ED5561A
MFEYMYLSQVLFGILCITRGEPFKITTKFWNGDLYITWPNTSVHSYDLQISKDTNLAYSWIKTSDNNYTLEDVTKYKSVKIQVRRYRSSNRNNFEDHENTYRVNAVESKVGDSQNISWTAAFFPHSGVYTIVHEHNGSKSNIIRVNKNGPAPSSQKYVYHSRPLDSTNILFKVRNITVGDAGFYTADEWSGDGVGVVLVVLEKPTKPVIRRPSNQTVGKTASLECDSRSTSVPQYYKKLPPLSYMWYVNDTKLKEQTQKTYRLLVTRAEKYNHYSCQAREKLESARSDKVLINPLYGPETIALSPEPLTATLSIHDGKEFGPFNCSADCNPACSIQWKYLTPLEGYVKNASSISNEVVMLPEQTANRTIMTGIQCEARGVEGIKKYNITLDIRYLSVPKIYINGKMQEAVDLKERDPLGLSCFAAGNPTPIVTLRKVSRNKILKTVPQSWLNYTDVGRAQYSDTGNYTCEGQSAEFGRKDRLFTVNVKCDLQLDTSLSFKSYYGSASGPGERVTVSVPVLANPPVSHTDIVWSGPNSPSINTKVSNRENFAYKQWIISSIPVPDSSSFGNYSLMHNGKAIVNIEISLEDIPHPPLNFTWSSYAGGYINLTWVSNFNGGPEQFFILSQKQGSSWTQVANLTDPGEGSVVYYYLRPLTPGQQYWYQLVSCNRINCSSNPKMLKIIKPENTEEKKVKDYKNHIFNTVESEVGDSRNISWTAAFFPHSGIYTIVHEHNGSKSIIIKVNKNGPAPSSQKYVYHSRPLDSTNILFEVKNITVEDAGYYTADKLSGEGVGVVLVVLEKPAKPIIRRPSNQTVGKTASLECDSTSTSVPQYYKKLPPLSYTWYVNDNKLEKQTQKTFELLVTKAEKYNQYSCQAKEKLESERSDKVQINPLYGPENIALSPEPLTATVSIRDGEEFGPFNCSADCYPACSIQWKYLTPLGGYVKNASSIGKEAVTLPRQRANRTIMTGIQCEARGFEGIKKYNITLDIRYLSIPIIYINGKMQGAVDLKAGYPLRLSCFVAGNPLPNVTLKKVGSTNILKTVPQSWLNYPDVERAKCSDTGNYTCEGHSAEFGREDRLFTVNVKCDLQLDTSLSFKSTYGSASGPGERVTVEVPVLANPPVSQTSIVWSGPNSTSIYTEVSNRENFTYKHWIISSIPVPDRNSFGNYSLMYQGKIIVIIEISMEDIPHPPLNFTWSSYAAGYINFTWVSNFNGGTEQFFILSQKQDSEWIQVANLTDPGEGNMVYHDLGPLTPGQQYWYQLESCNRINCSSDPKVLKIIKPAIPTSTSSDTSRLLAIGSSVAIFTVILAVVFSMHFVKKKSASKNRKGDQKKDEITSKNADLK